MMGKQTTCKDKEKKKPESSENIIRRHIYDGVSTCGSGSLDEYGRVNPRGGSDCEHGSYGTHGL